MAHCGEFNSIIVIYYTWYSLSIFSLAEILQLILEISVTYRLVSYQLAADNWLPVICRLRVQCVISKSNVKSVPCNGVFVVIYFKTMYNKTIIRFGFCDIRNNQGLASAFGSADNTYLDFDYSGYHKNLIQ